MKLYSTLIIMLLLNACATVKTLNPEDDKLAISHKTLKTYCEHIPRVYSGVAYNFCVANGETVGTINVAVAAARIPVVAIDSLCSAVADTVVLPYTIYRQVNDGSIEVK